MERRVELIWANRSQMNVGQQMQEHVHACYQLYYILYGNATFVVGDKNLSVKEGSCFLVPPMVPHKMLPLQKSVLGSLELKLFVKDPFLLQGLQDMQALYQDEGTLKRLLEYVVENWNCREEQNSVDISCVLSTVLLNFFVHTLHYENKDSSHILTDGYSALTRKILVYIETRFPYRFSLEALGEQLNYNKNYLCSVFAKDTGVTIVEYLNFVRVRRAVIFFAFYGQDVYTACESAGYANLSHFSRTFKAMVGLPPRDFRRAFSMLSQQEAAKYYADEQLLNYQSCTLEEAMASLRRSGELAKKILAGHNAWGNV